MGHGASPDIAEREGEREGEWTLALQGLKAVILADSQPFYLLIHCVTGWYVQKLNWTYNFECDPSLSNFIKYYALVSGQKVRLSTHNLPAGFILNKLGKHYNNISSSLMALQSNAHLCLLNGLLPASSVVWLLFPICNLHLLISVGTQFHHLFFGRSLSQLPWGLMLNTWLTSLLPSILLTWPIQFSWLTMTNESISEPPNSCINSLLYHLLQFLFTLIPTNILLKIVFWN